MRRHPFERYSGGYYYSYGHTVRIPYMEGGRLHMKSKYIALTSIYVAVESKYIALVPASKTLTRG